MRPRSAALLYVVPLCLVGILITFIGATIAFRPEQVPGNHQAGYVFLAIGVPLVLIPILAGFNNRLDLIDGEIAKRGAFRRISRWRATDIVRVHRYLRWMNSDSVDLSHYIYQFYLSNGSIAFSLSQAWWKPSQIDELVKHLGVKMTSSDT